VAARSDREAPRGDELNSLPAVNKAELESKHLAELHALAAEAGVPRYRMLRREDLIEKLAGGRAEPRGRAPKPRRERKPRQRREPRERQERPMAEAKEPAPPRREESAKPAAAAAEPSRPRRRRRRRFGRKRKGLRLNDLLAPGRQAIVYAETPEACTAMLREFAAELAGESNAPDPVVLLVDPGPEELAEWRREAPQAEIVAAAQARHADDAIAQAARRAEAGESVIVLIDSLSRLAEKFGDAEAARGLLDAGGPVTVVAALERR
jgi:Rho termination factor-like protein